MAARRSLFLLVMKTMKKMKGSVLWMMIMVNLCSLYTCDAALRRPELEQMDATNSGSEPSASEMGPIVNLPTRESVDLFDVSSGYVSASAWESIPPSSPQPRNLDRAGLLTPDQGFQSGDNIQAKESLADATEAKSDPHSGDLEQMLKEDEVTIHKESFPRRRNPEETTQDGQSVHSIRKAIPEMTSTEDAVSPFTSGSTEMLTSFFGFTSTVEWLLGHDDIDRKVHGVEHRTSTTWKEHVTLVTNAAIPGTSSHITTKATETTAVAKEEEVETMTMAKEATESFKETKTLSRVLEKLVTPDPESRLMESPNASTVLPSPDRSQSLGNISYANSSTDTRIFVTRNERNSNRSDSEDTTSSLTRDDTSTEDTYTLGHVTAHPDRGARPLDTTTDSFTTAKEPVTIPDNEARSFSEEGTTAASSRGEVSDEEAAGITNSDSVEPLTGFFTTVAGLFITQMEHKTSDSSSSRSSTQGVSVPRFTADGSYGPEVYRTRRQTSEHTDGDTFRLTTADVSSTTPAKAGDFTSSGMPSSASTLASETTPGNTVEASQQTSDRPGQEETTYEPPAATTAGKLSTVDYGSESTLDDTTLEVIASSSTFTTTPMTAATSSSEPPLTTTTTTMRPTTCPPGFFTAGLICLKEPDNVEVHIYGKCVRLTWTGGRFSFKVTIRSVTDGGRTIYAKDINAMHSHMICYKIPAGSTFVAAVVLGEGGPEALSDVITLEPSKPVDLKVSNDNETCVELQWSPGAGHTDSYEVRITEAGSIPGSDVNILAETNETSWTQCGLTPGAHYNLSVFSLSNTVRNPYAARLSNSYTTAPSPPTDGHGAPCAWNRQRCIDVQWAAGEGQSSGRYKVVRLDPRRNEVQKVDGTATNFTRLKAATEYTFRIRTYSQTRRLSLSPLEVKACTAPEPVRFISKDRVDSTWVEFWWNKQDSDIDRYILQWNDTQDSIMSMDVDENMQRLKRDGLRPGTTYDFRLVTVFCGLQTVSDPLTITTDLSDLTVEVDPVGTSLNISWAMEGKQTTSSQPRVYVGLEIKHEDGSGNKTSLNITTSPYIYETHLSGTCFSIILTPIKNRQRGKSFAVHAYTDEAAPEKVTNVQARRLTNDRTAINVTWSRPNVTNGVVSHYDILVRGHRNLRRANSTLSCQTDCQAECPGQSDLISRTRVQRNVPDSTFSGSEEDFFIMVGNLSEYENYDVQVVAATMAGTGPPVTAVVLEQLLDLVTDFTIIVRNATCLHLIWNPPVNALNGSGNSYLIEYGSRDEVAEEVKLDEVAVVNTTETAILVCGLEFWTMYQFNVTAFDAEGFAGKTEAESERTAEYVPDKVENLTAAAETNVMQPRKLSVRWSEPVHKYGRIVSYNVVILNSDKQEIVEEKHVSPRSQLNDSTGIYFSTDFLLAGDTDYTVQVVGATSAGSGSVARVYVRMPAGAVPMKGQSVYLGPETSVGMETAHVGLPWYFLCDVNKHGRPVMAGYIVFRDKWSGTGIRDGGVSVGPRPVVTKTWTKSNQNAPDVAFFVQLPVRPLRRRCPTVANRTFGIPVEVGSRSRTGLSSLCSGEGGGAAAAGGGVVQCGGGPLRPDTVYHVQAVVCTAAACSYSAPSPSFRTLQPPAMEDGGSDDVLVAVVCAFFVLLIIGGFGIGYRMYRRRRKPPSPVPLTSRSEENPQTLTEVVCQSRPVAVVEFIDHVEQLHKDSNVGFSAEYKLIKDRSPVHPTTYADLQVNKPKNRYKNILPWDKTRVELLATDDEEGSDYINANYLPGWKHQREFIAAQGPLPGTIDDFWRMVWENRVSVVVMLTQCVEKGKTKCEKYWPKEGEQEIYGDLVVHLRSESVLPDYIIRVIDFTRGTQSRIIKQFHFMQWPDFGCPERTSMLLSFVSSVRAHMPHSDCGPMVVHCSAGVGRTGTFIALDQLLQQIHGQTTEVDIFSLVMKMRDHRTMMVQTENQYIYIHDCLADALLKDLESDDEEQSGDEEEEHIYANC